MAQEVSLEQLAAEVLARHRPGARMLLGLAGAPASGKSTTAGALEQLLNAARPGLAATLPMDGYHYDDTLLKELGRLPRKGAIDTFDVGGFAHMLKRLRDNTEESIAVPVFDRDIEIARAGARLVPQNVSIIIVEGLYLLVQRPPWAQLKSRFDLTVMIKTDIEAIASRIRQRWQHYKLSEAEISRRLNETDLPNARLVMAESADADFVLRT